MRYWNYGKKATLDNFYTIKNIPTGVYLTGFVSNSSNQELIDQFFYHIKQHKIKPTIAKTFSLNQLDETPKMMENNHVNGKIVVANSQLLNIDL